MITKDSTKIALEMVPFLILFQGDNDDENVQNNLNIYELAPSRAGILIYTNLELKKVAHWLRCIELCRYVECTVYTDRFGHI